MGADFVAALDLLAEVGYTQVGNFLECRRTDIPIAAARASLAASAPVRERA